VKIELVGSAHARGQGALARGGSRNGPARTNLIGESVRFAPESRRPNGIACPAWYLRRSGFLARQKRAVARSKGLAGGRYVERSVTRRVRLECQPYSCQTGAKAGRTGTGKNRAGGALTISGTVSCDISLRPRRHRCEPCEAASETASLSFRQQPQLQQSALQSHALGHTGPMQHPVALNMQSASSRWQK
jgi:hypothetical protein